MSKTVDDLVKVYRDAFEGPESEREAVAAVVRAVRDEFGRIMYPGDDWNRQGVLEQFDQILGDAGNEKVAGSTPEGAVQTRSAKGEPPASPATDICEWEKLRNSFGFEVSCSTKWLMNENYGGDMCPLCDKRIEYKFEPATDPAPAPCLWRVHHETRNGPLYVAQCDGEWRHATADPKCPSCKKEIFFVTDPAPAVCEWTCVAEGAEYDIYDVGCDSESLSAWRRPEHCPSCGKPIKFTEAQR